MVSRLTSLSWVTEKHTYFYSLQVREATFNQGLSFLKSHSSHGASPFHGSSNCHQKFYTEQFQLSLNVKVQENIFNSVKTFDRVGDDKGFFSIFKVISLQFIQGLPATILPNLFFTFLVWRLKFLDWCSWWYISTPTSPPVLNLSFPI